MLILYGYMDMYHFVGTDSRWSYSLRRSGNWSDGAEHAAKWIRGLHCNYDRSPITNGRRV